MFVNTLAANDNYSLLKSDSFFKKNKALTGFLGAINEVGICSLHFRGFKPNNALHWMQLKVRKYT